jgi:hypothetical protein
VSASLDRIKRWFRREADTADDVIGGATPVAEPPAGVDPDSSGSEDVERETSTNAQMEGAADEPWPGNN